jgi:hypothetical protein
MKIIINLFIIASTLFAQNSNTKSNLEGEVISKINNEPIQDCIVYIKYTRIGTKTDSLGKFIFYNLNANKSYKLSISALGYPKKDTSVFLSKNESSMITIYLNAMCNFDSLQAIEDIKNGKAKLLLVGGIAPLANTKKDIEFEKNFNIRYYDFGCTPPAYECVLQYNKVIFNYLNKKYQNKWLYFVRKDVIGLK